MKGSKKKQKAVPHGYEKGLRMEKWIPKKRASKAGLPPGTPVYTGHHTQIDTIVESWIYDSKNCTGGTIEPVSTTAQGSTPLGGLSSEIYQQPLLPGQVQWIRVIGLGNQEVLTQLSKDYSIHPLVLEDILHVEQLPKIEVSPEGYFIVTGIWSWPDVAESSKSIAGETEEINPKNHDRPRQISLIFRENTLISFSEDREPVLDLLLERIKQNRGIIRKQGAAYALYSILDVIMDSYYHICDSIEGELDNVEETLEDDNFSQRRIQHIRKNLGKIRRYLMPLRESLQTLSRDISQEYPHLQAYFRDLLDHSFQIITLLENYRESLMSLHDLYLSTLSHKMNRIMKVLTIISTIFLPLTFLAGVYGMNFIHMPELSWQWGYPIILATMGVIAFGMLVFFRSRKWL